MARKPTTRTISMTSMVHAIAGPEQPYPVYQKMRRNRIKQFVERPGHNPFKDNPPADP